jgi:uncharacterized protein
MPSSTYLELLDWRRRMSELFAELRRRPADAGTLRWFRAEKDRLFRAHPQSPIAPEAREAFSGLKYWPYDPAARVTGSFTPDVEADLIDQPGVEFTRIGRVDFTLDGSTQRLAVFWITGYAGGLFLPFIDGTCGTETYGGGRYLLDTIKSADLGSNAALNTLVLDFNYAYHPSCAYDPIWVCPLAPPDSRLAAPIRAGERLA